MNSKTVIILFVVVILIIGGLWLVMSNYDLPVWSPEAEEASAEDLRQAILGEGAVTCNYIDPYDEEITEATLSVKDGEMRIDMTMAMPGKEGETTEAKTHLLVKEDAVYGWGTAFEMEPEEENVVFSFPRSTLLEGTFFNPKIAEEDFKEMFEEFEVSCLKGVSEELFDLPEDIELEETSSYF